MGYGYSTLDYGTGPNGTLQLLHLAFVGAAAMHSALFNALIRSAHFFEYKLLLHHLPGPRALAQAHLPAEQQESAPLSNACTFP